jgi:CRISPR/Cas system-associated protein endoribonuclease Cas2
LQVTRREADEAARNAQEKQILEEGIAALRAIHARVARGDLAARAPTIPGPLLPIAVSLNLMLDRLSALSLRGARYDQLVQECKMVQGAVERLGQGKPAWSTPPQMEQHSSEIRTIFLGLGYLQRIQESQWSRLVRSLDSLCSLTRRLREALSEIRSSQLFASSRANFERMIMDRVTREVDLLEQQQKSLLQQAAQASARYEVSARAKADRGHKEEVDKQAGDEPHIQSDQLYRTTSDLADRKEEQIQTPRALSRDASYQGIREEEAGHKSMLIDPLEDLEELASFEANSYSPLLGRNHQPHHIFRRQTEE